MNKCLFVLLDISYTSLQTDVFEWNSGALTYDVQTLTQILSLSLYDSYYRCLFILNSCSTGRIVVCHCVFLYCVLFVLFKENAGVGKNGLWLLYLHLYLSVSCT